MRLFSIAVLGVLAASCNSAEPHSAANAARQPPSEVALTTHESAESCPSVVDVVELLGRHARAYGTAEATLASLPRTIRFETDRDGTKSVAEFVIDKSAHRSEELVGGIHFAQGIDAQGAWSVGVGVPLRLQSTEATAILFESWFSRRAYLALTFPWFISCVPSSCLRSGTCPSSV